MNDIFTARQRSCGKIMFSRASVCSGGGGAVAGTSHVSWDRSHGRVSPSLHIGPGELSPTGTDI